MDFVMAEAALEAGDFIRDYEREASQINIER